jgi:succinyl-diaminopimelate desuccinylase
MIGARVYWRPDVERLTQRTLELVDIASESRHEAAILEHVAAELPPAFTVSHEPGEWVLAHQGQNPRLVLAGHVDTVPAQGNFPGRLQDGTVHGLGAADMKGGIAVMLEIADRLGGAGPQAGTIPTTLVFFAREELAVAHSPLRALFARAPDLLGAELAIMLEPTANTVQVGCLGNIVATAEFDGVACHSARPWQGRSAIDAALPALRRIADRAPREAEVGGHTFTEVVSVVGLHAGVADNVIPGRASARINFRYAPGRAAADAEAELRDLLGEAARVEIVSNAPSAAVPLGNRLVDALTDASGRPASPKIAWTPVAEFAAAGLDAINFGPGDPAFAHRADEQVGAEALQTCFRALMALIG